MSEKLTLVFSSTRFLRCVLRLNDKSYSKVSERINRNMLAGIQLIARYSKPQYTASQTDRQTDGRTDRRQDYVNRRLKTDVNGIFKSTGLFSFSLLSVSWSKFLWIYITHIRTLYHTECHRTLKCELTPRWNLIVFCYELCSNFLEVTHKIKRLLKILSYLRQPQATRSWWHWSLSLVHVEYMELRGTTTLFVSYPQYVHVRTRSRRLSARRSAGHKILKLAGSLLMLTRGVIRAASAAMR